MSEFRQVVKAPDGKRKLYDTSTAQKIYTYKADCIVEKLYRKRSGELFIHAMGGADTVYRRSLGNNKYAEGEHIIPLTLQAAIDWADSRHLPEALQAALFGIFAEDDAGMTALHFLVPNDVALRFRRIAAERGISQVDLFTLMLDRQAL